MSAKEIALYAAILGVVVFLLLMFGLKGSGVR
jgi:hypothetical protein